MSAQTERQSERLDWVDHLVPAEAIVARAALSGTGRNPYLNRAGRLWEIDQMVAARAWTDATVALLPLTLPEWRIRELAFVDDQWRCVLRRSLNNDTAAACDRHLPLAILKAMAEARRN